jgi:hypothetical protein
MSDNEFFTLDPTNLVEIFNVTHQRLCRGEITVEEANRIGNNMPEDWQFSFEEDND